MSAAVKSPGSGNGLALNLFQRVFLDWDKTQLVLSLILIVLFSLSPLVVHSPYYMGIIILTVIYAYVGLAWNITVGFAGQLLIGHVTFFGLGAYTTLLLFEIFRLSPWIGVPLAAIPSVAMGLLMSYLTLRYGLKLDYFALFTLAIMIILSVVFSQLPWAGGAQGIWITYRGVSFEYMMFKDKAPYLYIGLVLLLIGVILTYRIYRSKTGKYLLAIREDEAAAAALGVNTARYKTIALLITAAMEGVGGGFYAIYTTLVEPPLVFNLALNVELLTSPLIGGLGTIIGPLLGAILNKPVVEILRGMLQNIRAGSTLIVYGLFLIVSILFLPRGVAGMVQDVYVRVRRYYVSRMRKAG
jgi:branched-chain amino acid transport system permease protein